MGLSPLDKQFLVLIKKAAFASLLMYYVGKGADLEQATIAANLEFMALKASLSPEEFLQKMERLAVEDYQIA
jgi:hypothetical protein